MTGFSETQVASLEAPLMREVIKERQQAGRTFSYIPGWHSIAEANRIFGFDAWDREMIEIRCVAERERKIGSDRQREGHQVSYLARVRVTVRAGDMIVRRDGVGYGSGIDADLGAAHESAAKEAETDAMKRALVTFGNPFGLALYDKEQADVAPATKAPAASPDRRAPAAASMARSAAPPSRPNGAGGARAGKLPDHPRRAEAIVAFKRLDSALGSIKTTPQAAEFIREHGKAVFADLSLIAEVNPDTHASLKKRFAALGIDIDAERTRIDEPPPDYIGADDAGSVLANARLGAPTH